MSPWPDELDIPDELGGAPDEGPASWSCHSMVGCSGRQLLLDGQIEGWLFEGDGGGGERKYEACICATAIWYVAQWVCWLCGFFCLVLRCQVMRCGLGGLDYLALFQYWVGEYVGYHCSYIAVGFLGLPLPHGDWFLGPGTPRKTANGAVCGTGSVQSISLALSRRCWSLIYSVCQVAALDFRPNYNSQNRSTMHEFRFAYWEEKKIGRSYYWSYRCTYSIYRTGQRKKGGNEYENQCCLRALKRYKYVNGFSRQISETWAQKFPVQLV